MEATYRAKLKLTAILYLHDITHPRLEGSALSNFSMFRKLCGPVFYSNVILATTFWSQVDESLGRRREAELRSNEDFWGTMVQRGSEVIRLPDDRETAIRLLRRLAVKQSATLQIQGELVDQGLAISQTEAGGSARNTDALENLHEDFTKRLVNFTDENKVELQRQEDKFAKLQAEQDEALQAEMESHTLKIAEAKRKREDAMREAGERQERALEQHEEQMRKQRLETEALNAEVERLAIQNAANQAIQRRTEKQQTRDSGLRAAKARRTSQGNIWKAAVSAKRVRVQTSLSWSELLCGRCDHCIYTIGAGVSYCTSNVAKRSCYSRPAHLIPRKRVQHC